MHSYCLALSVRIFTSLSCVLGLRSHVIGTVVEAEGPAENTSSAPSLGFSSAPLIWARSSLLFVLALPEVHVYTFPAPFFRLFARTQGRTVDCKFFNLVF